MAVQPTELEQLISAMLKATESARFNVYIPLLGTVTGTIIGGCIGWFSGRLNGDRAFRLREHSEKNALMAALRAEISSMIEWIQLLIDSHQGEHIVVFPDRSVGEFAPVYANASASLGRLDTDMQAELIKFHNKFRRSIFFALKDTSQNMLHIERTKLQDILDQLDRAKISI